MTEELALLYEEYEELLNLQQFDPALLDYSILDGHRTFLEQLSRVENSAVTLFDMYKREHVFASYNFTSLLGYDPDGLETLTNEYFDSRIHPDDFAKQMRNSLNAFRFMFTINPAERNHYKYINEYRVRNGAGDYIRVIEQHQALVTDARHNIWLSLSVIDISPTQTGTPGVDGHIVNFRKGTMHMLEPHLIAAPDTTKLLTPRQTEILSLIKEGLLSKEISDRLSISIHTVNTHRQRILEKLGADNSMEAIRYASGLGLVAPATT
jgi:DNA-binding CsgD family transcriptional regulator/PAS domain-containing protein